MESVFFFFFCGEGNEINGKKMKGKKEISHVIQFKE